MTRSETPALLVRLTTLGDLARLRTLRLLEAEELSVGELARALQLPQSTVSRHLKLLHEGDWIIKRTEGTASFYRLVDSALDDNARSLWLLARRQMGSGPTLAEDDARMAEVLSERRADSESFFGRIGHAWDHLRKDLFGPQFSADALLAFASPDWIVADLGCGTGNGAELLAPFVKRIIAIDREPAMLDAAKRRLASFENVECRRGSVAEIPLDDESVDAAMVLLVMHHLESPATAVSEIARILKPGGVLLIVDMVAHDRESYRQTMGHRHLGFDQETIDGWARSAGYKSVRYHRLRPDTGAKGPGLFVATMRRPED